MMLRPMQKKVLHRSLWSKENDPLLPIKREEGILYFALRSRTSAIFSVAVAM